MAHASRSSRNVFSGPSTRRVAPQLLLLAIRGWGGKVGAYLGSTEPTLVTFGVKCDWFEGQFLRIPNKKMYKATISGWTCYLELKGGFFIFSERTSPTTDRRHSHKTKHKRLNQWFPNLFEPLPKSRWRICLNDPQYFAVIAHNIGQHCGFGSALPPRRIAFYPGG